ncbi:MAG: hypothetical protein PHQ75_00910 [Thermoguttaceae bacterium]|nr:hypothetical protein [Thermoguttaceae bacterium]
MKIEATFGPGTYFLGDPCYAMTREFYDAEWGEKHDYQEGDYSPVFAVDHTRYGDGEYYDQYGHSYPVDSGTIALTNITDEAIRRDPVEELEKCGRVITAERFARFSVENGFFTLDVDGKTVYEINTDEVEEEEEEEYFEDDEEEYED